MKKQLCLTSDFYDDLLFSGTRLTAGHLDDMMRYAASLGVERFEWIVDTKWTLYSATCPLDYDLLRTACDAAHRHGLRFDAVYKPFECGTNSNTLPHSFPRSAEDKVVISENGIYHAIRSFVADHPHCRAARREDDGADPGGRLETIRLVKFDEHDIGFDPDAIEIFYSETNGNFQPYTRPLTVKVEKEWRLFYPYDDRLSTVLSFSGFDLPETVRFFEIRCKQLSPAGSFSNHIENLVELVNDRGEVIPCAPSTNRVNFDSVYKRTKATAALGLSNYLNKPEVAALIESREAFDRHIEANCRGMYSFVPQWEIFTLDREGAGVIAVHRGKPACHPTELHPIYPEVRRSWLDDIQYCIDRGVDGVNIRVSRHGGMNEPWAYGFNDAVLAKMEHPDNDWEAAVVSGAAFDTFMEDAAQLLHSNGREIGVHLCGLILCPPDRLMATTKPGNIVWNWEKWVNEIVDYTEFHKTNFFKFHNVKQILDRFGSVVKRAGKPFIYQSGQSASVMHYDAPHRFLPYEMEWIRSHPYITCFNLYETASIFRLTDAGSYDGSPHVKSLVERHWSGDSPHLRIPDRLKDIP